MDAIGFFDDTAILVHHGNIPYFNVTGGVMHKSVNILWVDCAILPSLRRHNGNRFHFIGDIVEHLEYFAQAKLLDASFNDSFPWTFSFLSGLVDTPFVVCESLFPSPVIYNFPVPVGVASLHIDSVEEFLRTTRREVIRCGSVIGGVVDSVSSFRSKFSFRFSCFHSVDTAVPFLFKIKTDTEVS